MSPSGWKEVVLLLTMVGGLLALPQQSSSSSMTFARQRRQNLDDTDDATFLCILKANAEDRDTNSCRISHDDSPPPGLTPSILTSPSSTDGGTKKLGDNIDNDTLLCLLLSSAEGKVGNACDSSSTNFPTIPGFQPVTQDPPANPLSKVPANLPPPAVPQLGCHCVPHWQCKDKDVPFAGVDGNTHTSVVLDLRSQSSLSCDVPEEVCCDEVDSSSEGPTVNPGAPLQCGERHHLGVGNTFIGFKDQQSQFGEFPWVAAVVSSQGFLASGKSLYIGGGSLIHPQAVLTAAHIILKFVEGNAVQELSVRLGEWNLAAATEVMPHQEIHVRKIKIHPEYHSQHQYYDVAVLLLEQPAVLGPTVNTICLPSSHHKYLLGQCVSSGWGKKNFDDSSKYQEVMKKVSLPLVDAAACQAALRDTRLGSGFTLHHSFVCAGGQYEGQDTCTGDGGSPLACPLESEPDRYVQVGVVAWGIGCGVVGRPGVYADVEAALPWIEQVMSEAPDLVGLLDVRVFTS